MSTALALLVLAAHDVGYMLHAPYWNDEVWVAVSTKVPVHDLPAVIASTPIGWDLLLRLAPAGHPQAGRMVPLAFAGLAVVAAYWFIRTLPWPSVAVARLTATAAAVMALLSPSALIRNDLKQYTCDAFCVLVILWLTARAERHGGVRPVAELVLVGSVLFLFANPAALALGAGVGSLGLIALCRRDWARVGRIAAGAAVAVALLAAIYVGFYERGNIPGLRGYWATNYPPFSRGPGAVWTWFWHLAPTWFHAVGIGPIYIAVPLVVLGVVAFVRLGMPATGIAVPMLGAELAVLATMQQYPIFDLRTSHFLAVPVAVMGAVGLVALLLRLKPATVGVAAALAAITGVTVWHGGQARQHDIPVQTTRQDVQTVKAGWRPGDVIVANTNATWALAYYWGGDVRITPSTNTQQKFTSRSVDQPRTAVACPDWIDKPAPGQTCSSTRTTSDAVARVSAAEGGHTRIWVYPLHVHGDAFDAVIAWAGEHGYETTWPTHAKGSYLLLLTPRAVRVAQR